MYRRTDGEPVFVEAPALTDEELQGLLHRIITRLMKLLTRRGLLVEGTARTAPVSSRSLPPSCRHQGQERILTHLGLQARAPPRVAARGDLQQAP